MPDPLTRRGLLGAATASALLGALEDDRLQDDRVHEEPDPADRPDPARPAAPARMPVAFVSHGAPPLALDAEGGAGLRAWGRALPRPSALLVVSAHWERTPVAVGTPSRRPLLHDYHGFPDALARVRYDAPGAPELAARVADLTGAARADGRPWDHGVWVPLVHLFPDADVPLLQVSLPSALAPRALFDLGRALAPLRTEGVLVLASGGLVHNLRRLDGTDTAAPPSWAVAFEGWARAALAARDFDALVAFRERAPDLRHAHPTEEHLLPLLVAAGAAADTTGPVTFPVDGFEYGSLSRACVELR